MLPTALLFSKIKKKKKKKKLQESQRNTTKLLSGFLLTWKLRKNNNNNHCILIDVWTEIHLQPVRNALDESNCHKSLMILHDFSSSLL